MHHQGGCHCGAIAVRYESAAAPAETEVRACQCSFCRKHGSRAVSDSQGKLTVTIHDAEVVQRYRLGLATAAYFLCGRCGVYVVAVLTDRSEEHTSELQYLMRSQYALLYLR